MAQARPGGCALKGTSHPRYARYGLRFPGFSGHLPVPGETMSTRMEKSVKNSYIWKIGRIIGRKNCYLLCVWQGVREGGSEHPDLPSFRHMIPSNIGPIL